MKTQVRFWLIALSAALYPGLALAHPEDAQHGRFIDGVLHPLSGVDHLVAMVAVGVWAAQLGGRSLLLLPATFVAAMAVGIATSAMAQPLVEPAIAVSLVIFGLALAFALRPPLVVSIGIVAAAGLAHGTAHASPTPGLAAFAAGALVSTTLLHAGGLFLALSIKRHARWFAATAGAATAAIGALHALS